MDVLMGRGRHPKSRPGSLLMRRLLEENKEAYETAAKLEKSQVAERVLENMKRMGSRFLSPAGDGYVQCDDVVAREKISHGFRNLRLQMSSKSSQNGDAVESAAGSSGGGTEDKHTRVVGDKKKKLPNHRESSCSSKKRKCDEN